MSEKEDLWALIPDPTEEVILSDRPPDLLQPDIRTARRWLQSEQLAFFAGLEPTGLDYATICAWCRAHGKVRPSSATATDRAVYLASYEEIHAWDRQYREDIRRDVAALLVEVERVEAQRRAAGVALPPGYIGVGRAVSKARSGLPPAEPGDLRGLTLGRLCDLGRELWRLRDALAEHVPAPAGADSSRIAADLAALDSDPLSVLEVQDE